MCGDSMCDHSTWARYVWALYVWPLYVSTPCVSTLCEHSMCEHSMCGDSMCDHSTWALYVWALYVSTLCVSTLCVTTPCEHSMCEHCICEHSMCDTTTKTPKTPRQFLGWMLQNTEKYEYSHEKWTSVLGPYVAAPKTLKKHEFYCKNPVQEHCRTPKRTRITTQNEHGRSWRAEKSTKIYRRNPF